MSFENIILNERSYTKMEACFMSRIGNSVKTEIRLVAARGCGEEGMGVTATGYRVSVGMRKIVCN